jgi:aminopeptidase N
MRTQVVLYYAGGRTQRIPVTLNGTVTEVTAARGQSAPLFAFANGDDYGYFLTLLDSTSARALENGAIGAVRDPLLRTMLWGALWDQVRAAEFDPMRFVRLALRELPRERDEQIFPGLLGRMSRALRVYAPDAERRRLLPDVERLLLAGAADTSQPYGIRRAYLDGFLDIAETPAGVANLVALLSADSAAGEPMRDPTRWQIVTRLAALDVPDAAAHVSRQAARDTTPDGRRRAFIAGAARPDAAVKAEYFRRYFSDRSLNEDWASGSLGAFNAAEHASLTLRYLRPALDSLQFVQANRRIFYLQNWLSAFIGGHRSAEALAIVRQFLAEKPTLPLDLRMKVLQTMDELERTVRIRARWATATQ